MDGGQPQARYFLTSALACAPDLHSPASMGVVLVLTLVSRCSSLLPQAKAQLDDPNYGHAERERLRRLEEDRDAALAGDLFGSESVRPKDVSSDLPGTVGAKAAAAASSSATAASSASSSSSSSIVVANAELKVGARIEEAVLDTDADVEKFVSDLGKRLEKLGKSAMASKKIAKLISSLTEETIKLGVLRMDDVGELKRIMTVKHNELTTKQKKGDKKGANKTAMAKPVVALARNAFMHGDNFGSHADENPDDYGPQAQRVRGGLRMPSFFALFLMWCPVSCSDVDWQTSSDRSNFMHPYATCAPSPIFAACPTVR
jgi:hypothetical protein